MVPPGSAALTRHNPRSATCGCPQVADGHVRIRCIQQLSRSGHKREYRQRWPAVRVYVIPARDATETRLRNTHDARRSVCYALA